MARASERLHFQPPAAAYSGRLSPFKIEIGF
jgi:hypothetical protein